MFQLLTGRMLNTANDNFPDVEDPEYNLLAGHDGFPNTNEPELER